MRVGSLVGSVVASSLVPSLVVVESWGSSLSLGWKKTKIPVTIVDVARDVTGFSRDVTGCSQF